MMHALLKCRSPHNTLMLSQHKLSLLNYYFFEWIEHGTIKLSQRTPMKSFNSNKLSSLSQQQKSFECKTEWTWADSVQNVFESAPLCVEFVNADSCAHSHTRAAGQSAVVCSLLAADGSPTCGCAADQCFWRDEKCPLFLCANYPQTGVWVCVCVCVSFL